ncbi:MAG: IreB family regulatory phosphoprotein [Firmicutes bacterium]|nr:IreB family regulatory phosphoprotein [Bacillota bacterium]
MDRFETQKLDGLKEALKDVTLGANEGERNAVNRTIADVYEALREKGYNPVNQIVGYIISGDPTYITSYKDARKKMAKLEQDELLEEIVNYYINNNL